MKKINVFSAALLAMVSMAVTLDGHAASTYVFDSTSSATRTQLSGATDPSLSSFSAQYAQNAGTTKSTTTSGVTTYAATSSSGFSSGATWTNGNMAYYGGGGLGNVSDGSASPNHAIDNGPGSNTTAAGALGNTESVLLSFSNSVVLTSIGLGYVSGDADISLFRYTGTSAPTITGVGASLTSMVAAGWELVNNYSDLKVDTDNPYNKVNGSNLGSSWWLISAYNTSYGSTSANGGSLSQGDDYFKLYSVAATKCSSAITQVCSGSGNKVPEPGSMALVLAGLAGLVVRTRRGTRARA